MGSAEAQINADLQGNSWEEAALCNFEWPRVLGFDVSGLGFGD